MFGIGKDRFRGDTTVAITELGKEKADEYDMPKYKYAVLSALAGGTKTVSEVSSELGMDERKIIDICNGLLKSNYIRKVSSI